MDKQPISRSSLEAAAGIILGIIALVFTMTLFWKSIFMGIAAVIFLYIANKSSWTIQLSKTRRIIISAIIIILWGTICWYQIKEQWDREHRTVFVSPQSVKLSKYTDLTFPITITNKVEDTVFDVHLSICVSDKALPLASIDLIPYPPVDRRINFVRIGCVGVLIDKILRDSTAEFTLRVRGKNTEIDSRMDLTVYKWSFEPSPIWSRPISKEQFDDPPSNLGQIWTKEKESEVEAPKEGTAYAKLLKAPINPYFPDEKMPGESYWLVLLRHPKQP